MTDSTTTPPRPPRKVYSLPEETARAVAAWAEERGITDNAGFCILIRSGLINAIRQPHWMPEKIEIRGSDQVRRSIALPQDVLDLLVAWARQQGIARDVAVTILVSASIAHSTRIGQRLPSLPLAPIDPARRTADPEQDR